ncbi:DUF1667 domain-containing protein [Pyrococcus furiosus DSM 3638]|uniref:DUF1667 domain-containing protein n=3 Tax=Pyrococcus furiosus TaxID=2261 RepID=A0A5C0XS58_PYRFU|nr:MULTISPECIES: DUF1667 domain-containing protein [Pyrococcus]AAL82131.1 hypothetical protein PF2007 [Pyrococcus furiosus DSM 3638]AFN04635.1 hypothetical protein PFC_08525 [Pyrococcus furiosus COM1]MDK2869587.1 hypothetical protein [Pyrococcus sp.]QEK79601.1 DUF1667 domain-containing protein [Pyrococcus furiosus DSM 3638]
MSEVYRLTCIVCPLSCSIEVEIEAGKIKDIKGYTCPRGKEWAIEEIRAPKRVVMSVIPVEGGKLPTVSVKTEKPIPKDKIPELMKMLAKLKLKAPVKVGQVVGEFEGVKIIATREA